MSNRQRYQIAVVDEYAAKDVSAQERHRNENRIGNMETRKNKRGDPRRGIWSLEDSEQAIGKKRLKSELLE